MTPDKELEFAIHQLKNSPETYQAFMKYRADHPQPLGFKAFTLSQDLMMTATNSLYCSGRCDSGLLLRLAGLVRTAQISDLRIAVETLDATMYRPKGHEIIDSILSIFPIK